LLRYWYIPTAIVAVFALTYGAVVVTGTDEACAVCHKQQVARWRTSAHTQAGCPACHEGPRAWYKMPEVLVPRFGMVKRKVETWFVASAASESVSPHVDVSVTDERCRSCHVLTRTVTAENGTHINHAEHAKRNHSCLSCHQDMIHPVERKRTTDSLMTRCFCCHGTDTNPKAPRKCTTCHPNTFNFRPESHSTVWEKTHPSVLKTDKKECWFCHNKTDCGDCHGVPMPHPNNWSKGATKHSSTSENKWKVCEKCHHTGPDGCPSCHHEKYERAPGPWLKAHPQVVKAGGASTCFDCHRPTVCAQCHTRSKKGAK
jgi:hypothetical protein